MSLLPPTFQGTAYRLANNWFTNISPLTYDDSPFHYLEIGAFYGANLISVANTYATHPNSQLHCIDPWEDYSDYPEYKTEMPSIYASFLHNISQANITSKLTIHKGYSHTILPTLPDNYFDIIYIDGNHSPIYVLEDAVLSFRKLKSGGYLIFDDYGWGGPDHTQRGIEAFTKVYREAIVELPVCDCQYFVKKL